MCSLTTYPGISVEIPGHFCDPFYVPLFFFYLLSGDSTYTQSPLHYLKNISCNLCREVFSNSIVEKFFDSSPTRPIRDTDNHREKLFSCVQIPNLLTTITALSKKFFESCPTCPSLLCQVTEERLQVTKSRK